MADTTVVSADVSAVMPIYYHAMRLYMANKHAYYAAHYKCLEVDEIKIRDIKYKRILDHCRRLEFCDAIAWEKIKMPATTFRNAYLHWKKWLSTYALEAGDAWNSQPFMMAQKRERCTILYETIVDYNKILANLPVITFAIDKIHSKEPSKNECGFTANRDNPETRAIAEAANAMIAAGI